VFGGRPHGIILDLGLRQSVPSGIFQIDESNSILFIYFFCCMLRRCDALFKDLKHLVEQVIPDFFKTSKNLFSWGVLSMKMVSIVLFRVTSSFFEFHPKAKAKKWEW
jgi:hypothetical protein